MDLETKAETWNNRLAAAERHEDAYFRRVRKVIKTYRDDDRNEKKASPKMNLLWSNTETQRPSLYSATPRPVVTPKIEGQSKAVAREASDVLEKAIAFSIDNGLDDFDNFANAIVTDFLLPGRSVDRVLYEPVTAGDGDEQEVVFEQVRYHHVPWECFRYDPQDRWEDVCWVAYGDHFFTKDELKEEFKLSEKDLKGIPFKKDKDKDAETAQVWECWDKDEGEVVWVCIGAVETLREEPPPVKLRGFFDCARPCYAVKSNDSLIPIPEYTMYQYQAEEVNDLTKRIDKITSAIRANFAYAGDSKGVLSELLTSDDAKGIPVSDWTGFLERTGIDGLISWPPVEQFVKVLQTLVQQRQLLIQQIFEITGIADIMRGASDPRETAKAQGIKASFGSRRFLPKQQEIQRYFRDLFRISGEIVVENFARSTIEDIIDAPISDQAVAVLRDDSMRAFKVDIETDSTIQPDANDQKQEMAEFVGSLSQFSQTIAGMGQMFGPAGHQAGAELLKWFTKTFKAPRAVEDAIDTLAQTPPPPPPPDPNAQKMQMEMQAKSADLQIQQQKAMMDIQVKQKELELKVVELQAELAMKKAESEATIQAKTAESQANIMNKAMESQARRAQIERDANRPGRN